MCNGFLNDFRSVLFKQVYFINDVYVVILPAQQQDSIGMIEAEVLSDCNIVIIIQILRYLRNFPVMKNQAADLAPFAYNFVTNKPLPLALCMFPYSSDYILTSYEAPAVSDSLESYSTHFHEKSTAFQQCFRCVFDSRYTQTMYSQ